MDCIIEFQIKTRFLAKEMIPWKPTNKMKWFFQNLYFDDFTTVTIDSKPENSSKMGSRKRKLDVDGSPGSDYEPVSESWSKTEQYKVSLHENW